MVSRWCQQEVVVVATVWVAGVVALRGQIDKQIDQPRRLRPLTGPSLAWLADWLSSWPHLPGRPPSPSTSQRCGLQGTRCGLWFTSSEHLRKMQLLITPQTNCTSLITTSLIKVLHVLFATKQEEPFTNVYCDVRKWNPSGKILIWMIKCWLSLNTAEYNVHVVWYKVLRNTLESVKAR